MLQITFKLQKYVNFGQGVFIIGNIPELGSWSINQSFRLTWHQNHFWSGNVLISKNRLNEFKKIQYKYIVTSWSNQYNSSVQWQIGEENRKIDINFMSNHENIHDDWNMRKLKIHLIIKKNIQDQPKTPYRYSIIGNCSQLGNWKIRKGLRLQQNIDSKIIRKLSQNISKSDIIKFLKNQLVFQIYFTYLNLPRDQKKLSYYFIRENQKIQIQRHPGRSFKLTVDEKYPHRFAIVNEAGHTGIYDQQNFDKPTLSKITPQIYLGSYLKTQKDVKYLKKLGIQAIFSIQTSEDHQDHGISPIYLQLLCKKYEIIFKTIQIEDRNSRDFVQKSNKAVEVIDELIKNSKTTYVYCSAGKYRSPQMVALYLILKNGINVEEAIRFIQDKHPVAQPSQKIIKTAIHHIKKFDYIQSRKKVIKTIAN